MNISESKAAVSLIQLDVRPLAPAENLEKMHHFAMEQIKAGAQIIVFPELCNTGYVEPLAPGGVFLEQNSFAEYIADLQQASEAVDGPYTRWMRDLCTRYRVYIVAGLATKHPSLYGCLYNSSVLMKPDGEYFVYHKIHRWHMEKLYFVAGEKIEVQDSDFGKIGMQICYDIRFPEVTRVMALQGAQIITNIWASFRHIKSAVADDGLFFHRAYTRAVENGVFFLSCNRAGKHGDFCFMGRSCIIAPDGRVVAQSFSENEEVISAEINISEVASYRSSTGIFTDRRNDVYQKYF